MAESNWNIFALFFPLATFSFLFGFQCFKTRSYKVYPVPPGPKNSWFNREKDVSSESYPWKTYTRWKEIYGDIVYVNKWGCPTIIINSARVARELLEKRSANYSSRPGRAMLDELMGWEWAFSSAPYGESWRSHRRLFQKHFHPNIIPSYQPIQLKESNTFLKNLINNPDKFVYHVRRTAAAVVVKISYGYQIRPEGDWFVKQADEALATIAYAGIFGNYIVDYLPILKYVPAWVPGAAFKRQAREWKKLVRVMVDRPYEMVKKQVKEGNVVTSLVASELELLLDASKNSEPEEVIKNVAAISYSGGTDTTTSTILSFFLAMTLYPEIQKKAQEELDKVIGSSRLPTFEDREKLPYVDCILQECLRWNPVTPLSLTHTVMEDDVYMGMRIPKRTHVVPNVWGMLHDEAVYPDPFRFNPDRFLQSKILNGGDEINPYPSEAFGFGRRICPGRFLAESTIWIIIASVLATFNITKKVDKYGNVIIPEDVYTPDILSHPKPFVCDIKPRSAKAFNLIEEATISEAN